VNIVRESSFWLFVFGILVLMGGAVALASRLLAITLDISWWGIFAIVVGIALLAFAIRKESGEEPPVTQPPT
jgi:uncharacterized membrane protein HdeD (DUF308 family)